MTMIAQISDDAFPATVLQSPIPVLVDFGSKTCGVCLANAPAVATVAAEYEGEVTIVKVDVEVSPDIASAYDVRSLPTLILFRNGQPIDRLMGHLTRSALSKFIEKHLDDAA